MTYALFFSRFLPPISAISIGPEGEFARLGFSRQFPEVAAGARNRRAALQDGGDDDRGGGVWVLYVALSLRLIAARILMILRDFPTV